MPCKHSVRGGEAKGNGQCVELPAITFGQSVQFTSPMIDEADLQNVILVAKLAKPITDAAVSNRTSGENVGSPTVVDMIPARLMNRPRGRAGVQVGSLV